MTLDHQLVRRTVQTRKRVDSLEMPEVPRQGGVAVYNDANISVADNVWQALTFNSEREDDAAFHSTVVNTSRLTVPTGWAGRYIIAGHVLIDASAAGTIRALRITLNVGATPLASQRAPFSATRDTYISIATVYDLSAGDYVELGAWQDTGGALNVLVSANESPEFRMERVG